MGTWTKPPGTIVSRSDVQRELGGAIQGGILSLASSPYVLVYTDPSEGERYGYNRDGWRADGVFDYTGAGAVGDQKYERGNRAIAEHKNDGNALLLFEMVEDRPIGGKLHRFMGEFRVDDKTPFTYVPDRDRNGDMRMVYVFHLHPVGPVAIGEDGSDLGDLVGVSDPDQDLAAPSVVPPEGGSGGSFERQPTPAGIGVRKEAALVDRFVAWLESRDHKAARYRISVEGGRALLTDTYDLTAHVLYEAKSSASRHDVRLALGQLLDYHRYLPEARGLAVVLPSLPERDMEDLLQRHGIGLVVDTRDGFVERLPPGPQTGPS